MNSLTCSAAFIALSLSLAKPGRGQEATRFAACSRGGVLTSEGIGPLKIGLSPDSLRKVCRVLSERRIAEYEMTQFVVPVGSDTLLVHEQMGRAFWIAVRSGAFRTTDSLGVGSPIERLLEFASLDGGVGDGDDAYELHTRQGKHCGLVFWVDSKTAMAISDLIRGNPSLRQGRPNGPVLVELRRRATLGTIASIDIRGCDR
jgi:hypothetical protein